MENRVICPCCGYRMPIETGPGAIARGLFVKCKGRNCGVRFEIVIPPNEEKQPGSA
jgi:hypothetical protein